MSEVFVLNGPSSSLVFGLVWLPVLGGRARSAAAGLARRRRVRRFVCAGDHAPVGLAFGLPERKGVPPAAHSAAQCMATLYPDGTVAAVLALTDENHWLIAIHEGAVVARSDRLYPSREAACMALDELKIAYPHLGLVDATELDVARLFQAVDDTSRLLALSPWRTSRGRLLLSLSGLAVAIPLWLAVGRQGDGPPHPGRASKVDSAELWRRALDAATRDVVIHGPRGTTAVLQSLYGLPVTVAGWRLAQVQCRPSEQAWHCNARYDRKDVDASNASLIAGAPSEWRLEFSTIDQAISTWRVEFSRIPLSRQPLHDAIHTDAAVTSALQALMAAFSRVHIARPLALKIQAPVDAEGQPVPHPDHLPRLQRRELRFVGPLRSTGMLVPHTAGIAWKSISLVLHDRAIADLKTSRFEVSLLGDLYETVSSSG